MCALDVVQRFVHGVGDVEDTLRQVAELSVKAVGGNMAG